MDADRFALRYARSIKHQGFTLMEILVVMMIMGVVLSFAALSVPHLGKSPAQQAMEDFRRQWLQARDQSRLGGYAMGLILGAAGYRFVRFDAHANPLPGDEAQILPIPEGLSLQLEIHGSDQFLHTPGRKTQAQILLPPHSETTPFTLSIRDTDAPESLQELHINVLGLPEKPKSTETGT